MYLHKLTQGNTLPLLQAYTPQIIFFTSKVYNYLSIYLQLKNNISKMHQTILVENNPYMKTKKQCIIQRDITIYFLGFSFTKKQSLVHTL